LQISQSIVWTEAEGMPSAEVACQQHPVHHPLCRASSL